MQHDLGTQVGGLDVQTMIDIHLRALAIGLVDEKEIAFSGDQLDIKGARETAVGLLVAILQGLNKAIAYRPAKIFAIGIAHEHIHGLIPVGMLYIQVAGDRTTTIAALTDFGGTGEIVLHHRHGPAGLTAGSDGRPAGADAAKVSTGTKTVFG